jgi:hypothetical protein
VVEGPRALLPHFVIGDAAVEFEETVSRILGLAGWGYTDTMDSWTAVVVPRSTASLMKLVESIATTQSSVNPSSSDIRLWGTATRPSRLCIP